MQVRQVALVLVSFALTTQTLAAEKDVEGGKDHPLLSRMPGYYLETINVKDFDSYECPYITGANNRWEGKTSRLRYAIMSGKLPASMTQIARNYEAALKKIGAKVLASDPRLMAAVLEKGGSKTWVQAEAFNDGTSYELIIVEGKAMEQSVWADAAALKAGIAAEGKVAVYGIYFDTNKAVVKPESQPTLDEIVKLLKEDKALKLFVVGHTDGVGKPAANLKLSTERAEAVIKSLVAQGVDAARLKPAGAGPYCPVATNRTDAGKAKNRRVELVEQL
jgi:outer membrane protein OmpA-like peptidoglycan-associated protein